MKSAVVLWTALIIVGLVLKLTHLMSPALIVVGFAGLTAHSLHELFIAKDSSNRIMWVTAGCGIFLIVLLYGAMFNGGYPINLIGVMAYVIVLPVVFIFYFIRSRPSRKE